MIFQRVGKIEINDFHTNRNNSGRSFREWRWHQQVYYWISSSLGSNSRHLKGMETAWGLATVPSCKLNFPPRLLNCHTKSQTRCLQQDSRCLGCREMSTWTNEKGRQRRSYENLNWITFFRITYGAVWKFCAWNLFTLKSFTSAWIKEEQRFPFSVCHKTKTVRCEWELPGLRRDLISRSLPSDLGLFFSSPLPHLHPIAQSS